MSAEPSSSSQDAIAASSFDSRSLRDALGSFATGVTIVTTCAADGTKVGLTANSFSSVSLDPPLILWSLARTSSNIEAFHENDHFAVHILAADQDDISSCFSRKNVDRFEGLTLDKGLGGIPLLQDCMARFVCQTTFRYEGGDHIIFVGQILDFNHSARKPLVFHGGRYGMLLPKEPDLNRDRSEDSIELSDDLLYHVSNAFVRTRRDAIRAIEHHGWTADEYAVLSILGREGGLKMNEISGRSEMARGRPINEAGVMNLVTRELVEQMDTGREPVHLQLTTAGRKAVMELTSIIKASETRALDGFDPSEVHLLKHLLARLIPS